MRENGKHITRSSSDEARRLKNETDYARLNAMTDDDIAQAAANDPDAPPLDIDWTQARLSLPPAKDVITLRLDRDVLGWFRNQGKGYQTRINQVLRAFYERRSTAKRRPLIGLSAETPSAKSRRSSSLAARDSIGPGALSGRRRRDDHAACTRSSRTARPFACL